MALREQIESSGRWLYRWRSYLPLVVVAFAVLDVLVSPAVWPPSRWLDLWEPLCLAVSLVGVAIRVAAVGFARHGTSGRSTRAGPGADALATTGFYSVVRHPLYLGSFFMWLGLVLLTGSLPAVAIVILAFWLYYGRIAFAEEEFLRRKFGAAFEAWAARTPAFVPRLRNWLRPDRPFSVRRALGREYAGLFALALLFALLDLARTFATTRRFELCPFALAVLLVGTATYTVLATLKKRTGLLRVAGP